MSDEIVHSSRYQCEDNKVIHITSVSRDKMVSGKWTQRLYDEMGRSNVSRHTVDMDNDKRIKNLLQRERELEERTNLNVCV